MKITLAMLIDTLFSAFISFIILFIVLNYFTAKSVALTISICLCLIIGLFSFKLMIKKRKKTRLKAADEKAKEIMTAQLNLYTQSEQNELFERAIKKRGYKVERKKGGLVIKEKNVAIFSRFGFDGVSKTDIVKAFNNANKEYTIYVLAQSFSAELKAFANRFGGRIKTVDQNQVYVFLSQNGLLPKQKFEFSKPKQPLLSPFKNVLKKNRAKNHFIFGVIFLLTSYFVPIKIYYVIFGCLFLILSLICHLFGKKETLKD